MIGPGWLPRPSARCWRRRTLAYTRKPRRTSRRGKEVAPTVGQVNSEIVAFDHGPVEFPVAIVMPREPAARMIALVGDLRRWLFVRWSWLRPRMIPVLVAAFGTLFVLMSADYLAHPHATAHTVQVLISSPAH